MGPTYCKARIFNVTQSAGACLAFQPNLNDFILSAGTPHITGSNSQLLGLHYGDTPPFKI